ncbi:MAG: hypothetical protein JO256_03795 [Alphaproteobacteria bacterium]|nr:hypothetical protein [Alphaproteobacteria bacterium]
MEIHHKPKSWHGWRDFLKEFGTIVLGVSVALAAEQGVEWVHNLARAAEARAGIREEIARNLSYMNTRQTTEDCNGKRMSEVEGLIAAASTGRLPQEAFWIGSPMNFLMVDGKYKTAVQSGAASLFDNVEQALYSDIYTHFAIYTQGEADEEQAWSDLRTLDDHPLSTPTLDWQLRSAMQKARTARFSIWRTRQLVLGHAKEIGVAPAPQFKLPLIPTCLPLHTTHAEVEKLHAQAGTDAPIP